MYIFLIYIFFYLLLDFVIVTINLIQPLAAILIRINYLSIELSVQRTVTEAKDMYVKEQLYD